MHLKKSATLAFCHMLMNDPPTLTGYRSNGVVGLWAISICLSFYNLPRSAGIKPMCRICSIGYLGKRIIHHCFVNGMLKRCPPIIIYIYNFKQICWVPVVSFIVRYLFLRFANVYSVTLITSLRYHDAVWIMNLPCNTDRILTIVRRFVITQQLPVLRYSAEFMEMRI